MSGSGIRVTLSALNHKMKVAVWVTYVVKNNGETMHRDIIVPDHITVESIVHKMGKEYLSSKNQKDQPLTSKERRLCHQEKASPEMESSISNKAIVLN